jgi:hypothetical protein
MALARLAREISHALISKSALTLAQPKKEVKGKSALFDWAVGRLARENRDHA